MGRTERLRSTGVVMVVLLAAFGAGLAVSAPGCVRSTDDLGDDGGAGSGATGSDGPLAGRGGGGAGGGGEPPTCGGRCTEKERCAMDQCVPCGAPNQVCCSDDDAGCVAGQICVGGGIVAAQPGMCRPCGAMGQMCCPTDPECQGDLGCIDGPGTMDLCGTCGGPGQACCSDGPAGCSAGHRCAPARPGEMPACQPCGGMGQPCCDGAMACKAPFGCMRTSPTAVGTCGGCGAANQPCCTGQEAPCGMGLRCRTAPGGGDAETCQPCGGNGQGCCAGNTCAMGLRCTDAVPGPGTCRP
jgi:hypothetical protein